MLLFFALDSMNTPTVDSGGVDKGNDYNECHWFVKSKKPYLFGS
jgi:hypothetical protein